VLSKQKSIDLNPMFNKKKLLLLEGWAYAVEVLASCGLQILAGVVVGWDPLLVFVHRSARDWATLEGVLLAAALVIWGIYFSFMASDFGDYLRWDGSERVFRNAFTFAVFIQLIAAICMIVIANLPTIGTSAIVQERWNPLIHSGLFLLILSILNIPTLFTNTKVLLQLRHVFIKEKQIAESEMHPPVSPKDKT